MLEPEKLLKEVYPFNQLPEEEVNFLASKVKGEVFKKDEEVVKEGQRVDHLYLIVKGSCAVKRGEKLIDVLERGDYFGAYEVISGEPSAFTLKALEDCIVYLIPKGALESLFKERPEVKEALTKELVERLAEGYKHFTGGVEDSLALIPVKELRLHPPLFLPPRVSVQEAAREMFERGSSACLIEEDGELAIFTDKDIKRVVAEGKNPAGVELSQVASRPVITAQADEPLFNAILKMVGNNIKRLPVVEEGKVIGILEDRAIFVQQSRNFVFLATEIEAAQDAKTLKSLYHWVQDAVVNLVSSGREITVLQRFISEINDRFIKKALSMAVLEVGAPPSPFLFLAMGSEGRREQTIKTDIDNGIVYAEEKDRDYFLELGKRATEILLEIGFPKCPGGVMASNPEWVKSLREWRYTLEEWFSRPEAENLLKASIFLDFRGVEGDFGLERELRSLVNSLAKNYRNFLVAMAMKVLEVDPPINFFHRFVLEKSGEHKGELDVKRGGIFPITQGVRVLALEAGLTETNTIERLKLLRERIGKEFTEELIEAFKLLQTVRLKSQVDKIKRGLEPDNYVNPEKLTKFERDLLKDAFKVVSRFQELLGVHFRLRV